MKRATIEISEDDVAELAFGLGPDHYLTRRARAAIEAIADADEEKSNGEDDRDSVQR
jgi:hypothetical protein